MNDEVMAHNKLQYLYECPTSGRMTLTNECSNNDKQWRGCSETGARASAIGERTGSRHRICSAADLESSWLEATSF